MRGDQPQKPNRLAFTTISIDRTAEGVSQQLNLAETFAARYGENKPLADKRVEDLLRRSVQMRRLPGTDLIEIWVYGRSPAECAQLANEIAETGAKIAGCSYYYNGELPPFHRFPAEGEFVNPPKKIGWVPNPALFILMYEPPAGVVLPIRVDGAWMNQFQNWHYCPAPIDWTDTPEIALPRDPYKFISPIGFVDGHAAVQDFTRAIRSDPHYPMEATKDWMWYKLANTNAPPD